MIRYDVEAILSESRDGTQPEAVAVSAFATFSDALKFFYEMRERPLQGYGYTLVKHDSRTGRRTQIATTFKEEAKAKNEM